MDIKKIYDMYEEILDDMLLDYDDALRLGYRERAETIGDQIYDATVNMQQFINVDRLKEVGYGRADVEN